MINTLSKDKQIRITSIEAREKYKTQRFLLIDTVQKDGIITGTLYALSNNPSTLRDLVMLEDELQDQGHNTYIGGDYSSEFTLDGLSVVGGSYE